jgi:hypothetical protein
MTTCVRFAFPPEFVHGPIIYTLGKNFGLVTNIHRANIGDRQSWVEMELVGAPTAIAAGVGWLRHQGLDIARVESPPANVRGCWMIVPA